MPAEIMRSLSPYLLIAITILPLYGCSMSSNKSGVLIYGHEVRTVRLCNQTKTYWIQTAPELSERLKSKSHEMSKQPYQELYLEFSGVFTNKTKSEFAKAYDGVIDLQKVHLLSDKIPAKCN